MRRISIDGQLAMTDEHDLLKMIEHLADGYSRWGESIHSYHVSGFADVRGSFVKPPDARVQEGVQALENRIKDSELRAALHLLREQLQELIEVDGQIVEWLARFAGLASPRNRRDRTRLVQRLQRIVDGEPGGPQGPVWAMQAEYQLLVEKSEQLLAALGRVKQQMDQRLQLLLAGSGEEHRDRD